MTREEIYDEIARLRRERESDAPRAMQMDAIRKQDRDYEIDDPRTRYSKNEIRENALRFSLEPRAERRQLDRGSFAPETRDEAMTATMGPIGETRDIVTQAAGLIYWRDRLGIKVTTELGAADPDDKGFALWFARDRVEIARSSDGTVRVSVPKWHWDRSEIEGLVALPGRTPIEA
ncbi:MAG: hypothetical protein IT175_03155 [Acidobacteria bacterium]|nr:hypothetical protein [Acidobacteriota bacterium]